jgi:hypothetical protein
MRVGLLSSVVACAFVGVVGVGGCSSSAPPPVCGVGGVTQAFRFPAGDRDGHAAPMGAKAAGQARAGRVRDASMIRQSPDAKEKVTTEDYLLINDKIAVYIEGTGPSDAYLPFGGGILAIEPVGEDGAPRGLSQYNETGLAISRQVVKPESAGVIADGSDGGPAIVRVSGVLTNIPFLDTFMALSPDEYNFPAALDYVLEPGAEKVTIRFSLANPDQIPQDLSINQNVAFFQTMRNQTFTPGSGFGTPPSTMPWVAFDGGDVGFVVRTLTSDLRYLIETSGFQLFQTSGLSIAGCAQATVDYAEIITGSPGIDGALAALRRADKDTSWRTLTGRVEETGGALVGGGYVHVTSMDGARYFSRAVVGADGRFTVHAPPEAVKLVPTKPGYAVPAGTVVDTLTAGEIRVELAAKGTLQIHAREKGTNDPLPVRVQVVPTGTMAAPPPSFGIKMPANGRVHQIFPANGDAELALPPGEHRVIVSRGPEYELVDRVVTITAGQTTTVDAALERSVDSTGVMCADFHIHSFFSADSSDPVEYKVRGAIADGLEIPVSSEHEWIVDFQPTIEALGLKKWAFGFPSEELTTFTWGHFGVIPIFPRPGQLNNGAVDWVGKKPEEVFRIVNSLPETPVLIVNHPTSSGFGGYFSATSFDRASATGDPAMWSDNFEAVEVFNDSDFDSNRGSSVADWFALLNSGKTVWAVGNSDSHSLSGSPVGYPRTCFALGHDDPTRLSAEIVRDTLRAGKAVVSGGLTMSVVGPGGVGPGGTVPAGAGALDFDVVVQAPSWGAATTLEVIVDGQTVGTMPLQESAGGAGPGRRYEASVTVTPPATPGRHWVVLHANASGRDLAPLWPGRKPFAVSNPIFF